MANTTLQCCNQRHDLPASPIASRTSLSNLRLRFRGFAVHATTIDSERKQKLYQIPCQSPQTCTQLAFQRCAQRILPDGSGFDSEPWCRYSRNVPEFERTKTPVQMLQVCRQIYYEAVLKPFANTTFHFVARMT